MQFIADVSREPDSRLEGRVVLPRRQPDFAGNLDLHRVLEGPDLARRHPTPRQSLASEAVPRRVGGGPWLRQRPPSR
jgi:hypothetical protein